VESKHFPEPSHGQRRGPFTACAVVLCLLVLAGLAAAQRPFNLDFEQAGIGEPHRPWGWTWGWSVFTSGPAAVCSPDSLVLVQGRRSLSLEIPPDHAPAPLQSLMLQVPARFALGHTLELDMHLRVTNKAARAVVSLEAWGDRVVAAADSVSLRGSEAGDAAWQVRHLTLAVPRDSTVHSVVIQVGLEGTGKAWFDGGQLHLDGHAITALPAESAPPTGRNGQAWPNMARCWSVWMRILPPATGICPCSWRLSREHVWSGWGNPPTAPANSSA
jgi:hypothetical protein